MSSKRGSKSKRLVSRSAKAANSPSSSTTSSSKQFLETSIDGQSSPASSSARSKPQYFYTENLSSKENVTVTVRFRPLRCILLSICLGLVFNSSQYSFKIMKIIIYFLCNQSETYPEEQKLYQWCLSVFKLNLGGQLNYSFQLNWEHFLMNAQKLIVIIARCSPREIRQGEEIAWYADGETIVRNEHNPSIAYAYGKFYLFFWLCISWQNYIHTLRWTALLVNEKLSACLSELVCSVGSFQVSVSDCYESLYMLL